MSRSVDERVVEMRFENEQFEKGVQTSLSTLDRLKESLDFLGAGKALGDFGATADSISGIGTAAAGVKDHFSALETIATGALLKLGSMVADVTMNLLDQVNPLNQVADGWNKYAEKTTSVQTIMAATRTTWEESAKALGYEGDQMGFVSEQLDKLNWFTDETSYSFNDMVGNIGKFTNNNIPLEEAVTSMEGIATWAGLSGANVQDASRAMYNFSQAMGAGAMKLQDWKSIENANMATTEFKQAAIDTAIELGRLKEVEEGVYIATEQWGKMKPEEFTIESFSTQLSSLWMNKDVMTATLQKFGGFTDELNKFYNLVGDHYDTTSSLLDDLDKYKELSGNAAEQTKMLEEVSRDTGMTVDDLRTAFEQLNSEEYDMGKRAFRAAQEAKTFQEAIDSVKDAASTAWMRVFESIFGNYEEAKKLWTGLANSLWDAFVGPVDRLATIMGEWNSLGGRDSLLEGFTALGEAAEAIFGAISEAFGEVFGIFDDHVAAKSLKDLTDRFRDFAKSIKPSEEQLEKIKAIATTVATVLKNLGDAVKGVAKFFIDTGKEILNFVVSNEKLQSLFTTIGDIFTNFINNIGTIKEKFNEFSNALGQAEGFTKFNEIVTGIKDTLSEFGGNVIDTVIDSLKKISDIDFSKIDVKKIAGDLGKVLGKIAKYFTDTKTKITTFFDVFSKLSLSDKLKLIFTTAKDSIKDFYEYITGKFTEICDSVQKLFNFKTTKDGVFSGAKEQNFLNVFIDNLKKDLGISYNIGAKVIDIIRSIPSKCTAVVDWFKSLKDIVKNFLSPFGEFFDVVRDKCSVVTEWFAGLIGKVSEFLSPAKDFIGIGLGEAFEKIGDAISGFNTRGIIDTLSNFINKIKELPIVSKAVELVSSAISKISEFMSPIIAKLGEYIKSIKEGFDENGLRGAIDAFLAPFKDIAKKIKEYLDNSTVGEIINDFINKVSGFFSSSESNDESLFKPIKDFFDKIIGFLAGIDMEKVKEFAILIGLLALLVDTCKMFSGIGKATTSISELLDAFTGKYLKKGSKIKDAAALLFAVGVALAALSYAVKELGEMDTGQLVQGELALAGIAVIIGKLEQVSTLSAGINTKSIVAIAAALAVMCYEVKSMAELDFESLLKGVGSISLILLALGKSLQLASWFSRGLSFGAFLEAAIALYGVTLVLKSLADGTRDMDAMLTASESVSLLLLSLGGALAIVSTFASNISLALSGIASLDLFILNLVGVIVALGALSQLPYFTYVIGEGGKLLTQLGYILGSFIGSIIGGIATAATESFPDIGQNLSDFATNLKGFFEVFGDADYTNLSSNIKNIGDAFLELAGYNILDSISKIFTHETTMEKLSEDLDLFAQTIVDYFDTMSEANIDEGKIESANAAAKALIGLKEALPDDSFFNMISLRGEWGDFTKGLLMFGSAIIEYCKLDWDGVSAEAVNRSKPAVSALVSLKESLPDQSFISYFTGYKSWGGFVSGLILFGNAIIQYSNLDWENVSQSNIETSAAAAGSLIKLKESLPDETFLDSISLYGKWGDFVKGLPQFAEAIIAYASKDWSAVTDDKIEGIKQSVKVSEQLVALKKKLPDESFFNLFADRQDWSLFSSGLGQFAQSVYDYASKDWSAVSDGDLETAEAAVLSLISLKDSLPEESFLDFFTGYQSWDTFSDGLSSFAEAIGAYNDVVTGESFDSGAIKLSVEAALALCDLSSVIDKEGGLIGSVVNFFVGGNSDWDGFKKNIVTFAEALGAYSKSLKDNNVDVTTMSRSVEASKKLVDLIKVISEGKVGSSDMNSTFATFGENIATFSSKLKAYYDNVKTIDWTIFGTSVTNLNDLIDLFKTLNDYSSEGVTAFSESIALLGQTSITDFCEAFFNSQEDVNLAIDTMIGFMVTELGLKAIDFKLPGITCITEFINGVVESQELLNIQMITTADDTNQALYDEVINDTFRATGRTADEEFAGGIEDHVEFINDVLQTLAIQTGEKLKEVMHDPFYNAAIFALQGFAQGISDNISIATSAASSAGIAASQAFAASQLIASPSKLWEKFGVYDVEGFVLGLQKSTPMIEDSARNVAASAVDVLSDVLNGINDDEYLDSVFNPTIVPVLDLSNVKTTASNIGSMLGGDYILGAGIGGVARDFNGMNAEMLNALNSIKPGSTTTYGNISVNVYAAPGQNASEIADMTLDKLNRQIRRQKAAFA